jgi:NMD protein affecting ribosome stability and mRNA decay
MARCPVCGKPLDWAELIEQMLSLEGIENILKDREKFMETLENFTFKCPHCGEEFYGRYLPREEAEKVFELLNEFKGSIDWENGKVRLRLNNLLALDTMLEQWDRKVKG